ncbi:formylglycine-generating enzyme family protein [Candidatus Electronema sp. JM]|uniref:formylglycine-generating enzyme family protein n=1 Tax=Candidatus Electronema sp. JM TaxID=3401571 RepID=UPI003AA8486A
MAEEEKKKSFWETLPGIITAIAALITAIAALVAAMNSGSKDGAAKPDASAAAAPPQSSAPPANDEAARRAAELERKLSETAAAKAKAEADALAAKARAEEAERHAAELERKKAEPQQGDIKVDDVTGMDLVYVPGGCFQMGSPESEQGREDAEKLHEVCVDGFWMGKTEVTQGQWQKVMGSNPAEFQKGDDYPVEQVSWDDAQDFIKKLNGKAGRKYRLPTEAEWEYAARAGTSTAYFWGDLPDEACKYANVYDQTSKKEKS